MNSSFGRTLSVGTAAYAVFALVKPRHLGAAMTSNPLEQGRYDLVATTFGARDLVISSVAIGARSPSVVRAAMLARVALDLADCLMLAPRASGGAARAKVLAATLTWASLNTAAIVIDARND